MKSQAFGRVCTAAGIDGLTFHDLRHEATSRLFEKGLNPMEVAAITGHKTLQMLKRYTHLRAEDLVEIPDTVTGLTSSELDLPMLLHDPQTYRCSGIPLAGRGAREASHGRSMPPYAAVKTGNANIARGPS